MKYVLCIIFCFCFSAQVFASDASIENPNNPPGTNNAPAASQPASTTNDTNDTAAPAPAPTPATTNTPAPTGPVVVENQKVKEQEERDQAIETWGWDRRFLVPDGLRISMDFRAMYSRQYGYEGGVNINRDDIEHNAFSSEGLIQLGWGDGKFALMGFLYGRNIGDTMEKEWATYLGYGLPELTDWVQTHYSIIGGEFMFRPFEERLHLFVQAGWRSLGFAHSPKWPVHLVGGLRFSTGRYFNMSLWGGTEVGLEMGSPFWHGKDAEGGLYLRGNWIWSEEWRFENTDFLRNVVEAEIGFRANFRGRIGFTLGARHTWNFGWYPDERNAYNQRQPALRLDSFQLFAGIQLCF